MSDWSSDVCSSDLGLSDHKMMLSADGDSLDVLARVVDFEAFRATVVSALHYSDRPLCIIRTQIHSCSFVCSGRWLSASRSRRSDQMTRSEERSVGKKWEGKCRTRW